MLRPTQHGASCCARKSPEIPNCDIDLLCAPRAASALQRVAREETEPFGQPLSALVPALCAFGLIRGNFAGRFNGRDKWQIALQTSSSFEHQVGPTFCQECVLVAIPRLSVARQLVHRLAQTPGARLRRR